MEKVKRGLEAHIGFDLDGTLAYHEPGDGIDTVGEPIQPMVDLAKKYIAAGYQVRIITARVSPEWTDRDDQIRMIQDWTEKHIGERLIVQAHKNGGMLKLYDDRGIGVVRNTGRILDRSRTDTDKATQTVLNVFFKHTGMYMDPRVAGAIANALDQETK